MKKYKQRALHKNQHVKNNTTFVIPACMWLGSSGFTALKDTGSPTQALLRAPALRHFVVRQGLLKISPGDFIGDDDSPELTGYQ